MRCPRCHHASGEGDASCIECGAPLLIGDEPAPAPLDRVLDLDRRASAEPLPLDAASGPVEAFTRQSSPDLIETFELDGPAPRELEVPAELDLGRTPLPHGAQVPVGRRVGAAALDALVLASVAAGPVVLAARTLPAGHAFEALFPACAAFVALLGFTYEVLGHALMGATVGKWVLGLRVTGPGGTPPGLARSAARAAVAVIGTAGLGIGMLVGLFTQSGRSLHDVVAGTSVVRAVDPTPRGA